MQYRALGDTGLELPALSLGLASHGGWRMGGTGDPYETPDREGVLDLMRRALDLGITVFDDAPYYGDTQKWFGEELRDRRHEVFFITKTQRRPYTRESLLEDIEGSLTDLRTDYADLFVVFNDTRTGEENVLEALRAVQDSGKARYVGVTNWDSEMLGEPAGRPQLVTNQVGYSLFDRFWERDVFPVCAEKGIGVMAYSPLAQGLLSGHIRPDTTFPPDDVRARGNPLFASENLPANVAVVRQLQAFAAERGATVSQLALAWILANPLVASAVVGTRRPGRLEDNVKALDIQLSAAEMAEIDEIMEGQSGTAPRWGLRPL